HVVTPARPSETVARGGDDLYEECDEALFLRVGGSANGALTATPNARARSCELGRGALTWPPERGFYKTRLAARPARRSPGFGVGVVVVPTRETLADRPRLSFPHVERGPVPTTGSRTATP